MRPQKFLNRPQVIDGVRWHSKKELARWRLLYQRFSEGVITGLRRQVPFRFIVNGVLVCEYRADFVYVDDGRRVVEDVKSPATRTLADYRIKKKLMLAVYGITVREV